MRHASSHSRHAFAHWIRAALILLGLMRRLSSPDPALAQNQPGTTLTWATNSSVKLEQLIGDCDWTSLSYAEFESGLRQCAQPTASKTISNFHIMGNGLGYSFEDQGKLTFLFGDTISEDPNTLNYHAADPIAWSTSTNPEAGLILKFFTNQDGTPLFVKPPGIPMGPFDVPNSGIRLSNEVYLVCNTGSDTSLTNLHANDYSVLVRFDEASQTFATNRILSQVNAGGHFVITALHQQGTNVLLYGLGAYRATEIYLAVVPASTFESGAGTHYFAGMTNGQPMWTTIETQAAPVVVDNPLSGPGWPNDNPTVGNVSVSYAAGLQLWLMTYDGGRQSEDTEGVYFCYAAQPWGPWSQPQLIFNAKRDHGFGVFIHNSNYDPPGPAGPTIGSNDPNTTRGGDFAPQMIERFTTISNSTLLLYYTLSTWNPYTVIKMRSAFTITAPTINPPKLAIQRVSQPPGASGMLALSWPATNTGVILQSSPNLTTMNWQAEDLVPIFDPESAAFSVLVPATNTAGYYRLAPAPIAIHLGTPQPVFQFGQPDALGLFNVPDMHTAVLPQSDGSYRLWISGNIGTNGGSVGLLSTTDFFHYLNAGPGTPNQAEAVFTPSCDGFTKACLGNIDADYAGANAVLPASHGTDLLMFYEAGNKSFGGTNYGHSDGEFNVIALARSTDQGLHWTREGTVLSGPDPQPEAPPGTSQPGISEPGVVLANGYYYMFYQYIPNQPTEPEAPSVIQAARAPVASDGAPGNWMKYYHGSWSEPGIGGHADIILPTGTPLGCTRPVQVWPVFSNYLNAFVLLFLANEGWFFSTSTDLISWTPPANFLPELMWQNCQPMDWNYVFVTPGMPAGVIGQSGYVLYAHTDSKGLNCPGGFSPHELWVRPFNFTKAP
jgi:hypothetical protein